MKTQELQAGYDSLPETGKTAILALSVLIERIRLLPEDDRDDLFELLQGWRKADSAEEQHGIRRAMEEILAQGSLTVQSLPVEERLAGGVKSWAEQVGVKIKALRDQAGLTQTELAEKAGLPQSHISRLENAAHSATNLTLGKIAKALGADVTDLDPYLTTDS